MITLEKFGVQHTNDPKGKWQPISSNGEKTALIYCPSCGSFKESLELAYRIDEDGIVTPSFVCNNIICNFNENIKLQDW